MSSPNRIREWREHRGMSQETLAEEAGLSVGYLSRMERGKRNVSLINLEKLARALHVKQHDLVPSSEVDGPLLYKGQPRDSDSIQVEVGALRNLIAEALSLEGLAEEEAKSYADGVLGSIVRQQAESVVVRLKAPARNGPESRAPKPGSPS